MSAEERGRESKDRAVALFDAGHYIQAGEECRVYLQLEPNDADMWILLSAINGALGLNEDAEDCGKRAISLNKENVQAYFNTAVAQYNLKKPADAVENFDAVLRRQPNHGFAMYLMGRCYEMQVDKEAGAIELYERALRYQPQPPHLAVHLINLYKRVGEHGKAAALLGQSLSESPLDPLLVSIKARQDIDNGNYQGARHRLENLLESGGLSDSATAGILNELGLLLDRMGEYDKAFDIFGQCHEIDSKGLSDSDRRAYFDVIAQCRSVTTREKTSLWAESMPEDGEPSPIFLVGFPRSGTTLVERIISGHPETRVSGEEGLLQDVISMLNDMTGQGSVYPLNLNGLTPAQVESLRTHYWRMAEQKCGAIKDAGRFLDKSPLNIIDLCLVYRIFPDAKVIVMLRDPRDACLSCYMQRFDYNLATYNFLDLESTAKFYEATMTLWWHYRSTLGLDTYVLQYEDLVSDLAASMEALFQFLGLAWDDGFLNYHDSKNYKTLTPSYHDTGKPIFSRAIGRWRYYEKYMRPVLPILESFVRGYGYNSDPEEGRS